jgi:hypothetical protein
MTDEFTGWRKSSHSATGQCVEVGHGPAVVGIRDSQDPDGTVLAFPAASWKAFTSTLTSRTLRP